ncbi:hypothetical protein GXW83_25265 [Streptacidiphilus sp. PB12-B1b]|uniref:hypothetical protein n=1 Tax=Streptacidiphilus sp. PB12-B1b TaxID=2705012 RepID=UPI0015FB3FB9|nr:hypothetical protein [Streptacidiphilus sp. PB12-B1b]QMU78526.1 hypothetical protein GXW83_25265 [Streptacidiphilus sp. PB12-B1b]
MRTALLGFLAPLALLATALLGSAVRDHRPAPFGDDLVARSADAASADALRPGRYGSVQAYDRRSGRSAWSYRRPGRTPLRLVGMAGTTVAVWDDGMLTGMSPDEPAVRWHRFVPGLAGWLAELRRSRAGGPGVLLAPFDAGREFLVLTPGLVVTYTTSDGAIRTDTLPPPGCGYDPGRARLIGQTVVVSRPCAAHGTVEGFGRDGRRWQIVADRPAGPPSAPGAAGAAPGLPPPHPRPQGGDSGPPPVDWAP